MAAFYLSNQGKMPGNVTLPSSVTLDNSTPTSTISLSDATGTVSALSSNNDVATVEISGSNLVITAVKSGSTTIIVNVSENESYSTSIKTISVTSNCVALVSWATGTDEEIAAMVDAYYDGTISLQDIQSVWNIGDEREVTLSAMAATGVGESHASQTVKFVLMNWGGKNLADDTTCLAIVGQKNSLSEVGYMNSSNTNTGGWNSSARRTWCNDVYKESIPSDFRSLFKQHKNLSGTGGGSSSGTQQTTDYFALPAEMEVFGSRSYSVEGEGSQFKYYETSANRVKTLGEGRSASFWWERSPFSGSSTGFCGVNANGTADYNSASNTYGLAPFGCI